MDLGGNWEAVFPCMPARSLIYKFGFIGWQPRRVGDTIAPPRGRSGLQTLLANETADEERSSGENQPAGQRNAVEFWHSEGSLKSIWHSSGTVDSQIAWLEQDFR